MIKDGFGHEGPEEPFPRTLRARIWLNLTARQKASETESAKSVTVYVSNALI